MCSGWTLRRRVVLCASTSLSLRILRVDRSAFAYAIWMVQAYFGSDHNWYLYPFPPDIPSSSLRLHAMDITSYSLHAPSAENMVDTARSNQDAIPTLRSQFSSAGHDESALDTSSVDSLHTNPLSKDFLHPGPKELRSPSFQLRSLPSLSERRGSHRASGTSVRPVVVQEALDNTTDKKDSENIHIDVFPKSNTLTPTASIIPSLHFQDAIQISPAQAAKFRRNGRIQFAALCWTFFLQGWNDGTAHSPRIHRTTDWHLFALGSTGPLLPKIQSYYNVIKYQSFNFIWLRLIWPYTYTAH